MPDSQTSHSAAWPLEHLFSMQYLETEEKDAEETKKQAIAYVCIPVPLREPCLYWSSGSDLDTVKCLKEHNLQIRLGIRTAFNFDPIHSWLNLF